MRSSTNAAFQGSLGDALHVRGCFIVRSRVVADLQECQAKTLDLSLQLDVILSHDPFPLLSWLKARLVESVAIVLPLPDLGRPQMGGLFHWTAIS